MKSISLLLLFSLLLQVGCADRSSLYDKAGDRLSISDQMFVEGNGATVILNGINHVVKDPVRGYLHEDDEQLFKQFKKWGFNCIRYGIIWDGLEPEPGVINEKYLREIDKRVKWAADNDIWLILDMHQDLYSRKYSDGAPLWATFDDNLPHVQGDVWSDAYLVSPAIHRVFDNFWSNKKACDSIGIQDHYVNAWKVVAERYADSSSVAGFDIMNEPFMGSSASDVLVKLFEGYGGLIAEKTGVVLSEEELMDTWGDEKSRIEALDMMNDKELYLGVVEHAKCAVDEFEQNILTTFYQRVRDSIRLVNNSQILFLEHNYFSNLGVESSFAIPIDEFGIKDSLCAYAPHGYDLVTDTQGASKPGYNRVEVIFDQIFKSADVKGVPSIIGEWGAFYLGDTYKNPTEHLVSIYENNLAGQTYWAWWQDIETQDYFLNTIVRTYPMLISGTLHSYSNNWDSGLFACEWSENKAGLSSRIFIPDVEMLDVANINLEPKSEFNIVAIEGAKSGYLDVASIGGNRKITLY